jgi:hypothetical protein
MVVRVVLETSMVCLEEVEVVLLEARTASVKPAVLVTITQVVAVRVVVVLARQEVRTVQVAVPLLTPWEVTEETTSSARVQVREVQTV